MDVAIMTSGGLDSFIAYNYAAELGYNPIPIWVDLGQPYVDKERTAIESFPFEVLSYHIDYVKAEDGITPTNQVIPARNLLLALIGAKEAERVWICALESELDKYTVERDKTPEFYHLSSGLFTYVFNVLRPETIVETPFSEMSKTEIVGWALKHGITPTQLKATSTCYDEDVEKCGHCSTCFKRWVAFENNYIEETTAIQPWTSTYASDTVTRMTKALKANDFSHYSPKRLVETAQAFRLVGVNNTLTRLFGGVFND
ncbi:MAG: 7-cyano-7-deazaguanine synthase [bacterium]